MNQSVFALIAEIVAGTGILTAVGVLSDPLRIRIIRGGGGPGRGGQELEPAPWPQDPGGIPLPAPGEEAEHFAAWEAQCTEAAQ